MYTALKVPVAWLELESFYKKWIDTVQHTAGLFDLVIESDQIQRSFTSLTAGGTIDFGLLDEGFQKQVITRLVSQNTRAHLEELLSLNPFLATIGSASGDKYLIEKNRNAVIRSYSLEQYRQTLLTIYARVVGTIIRQRIDKHALLAEFFDLTKFSLLKWGDYGI